LVETKSSVKKEEPRRRSRARHALVALPSKVAAPLGLVWASWLLSYDTSA
jgi:hypothetical protein